MFGLTPLKMGRRVITPTLLRNGTTINVTLLTWEAIFAFIAELLTTAPDGRASVQLLTFVNRSDFLVISICVVGDDR